jgi:phage shock protein PspC (stress-responsive transcriptional regulator)
MNKVININLSGRLISIDEEAYKQLNAYLAWLQQFFAKEEGGVEIYKDMEDRIAELFEDKLRKNHVSISEADVQAVIKIMGSPEQIAMENKEYIEDAVDAASIDPTEAGENAYQSSATQERAPNVHSPLRRDLNNKIIGGVSSGLANYFNIDPVLVRVLMALGALMYGTTVLIYILLWIFVPGTTQAVTPSLKKRWYRTDEGKIVGGVCSGLSYQLRIPKQTLRGIFALPLIGIIFFNIIGEDNMASACVAALPTLCFVYLVLWIALPKASTLTQLMELKGEKLDVQNLRYALREQNEQAPTSAKRTNPLTIIFKVFAYIVLGFVLLIVGTILISLLVALAGILFGFSVVGISVWPLSDLIFTSQLQAVLLYISAILLVLIPIVALVRWLFRRINKKKKSGRWLSYTLGSLFFLSLFAVTYIISSLGSSIRYTYKSKEPIPIVQPKDTLEISSPYANEEWASDFDFDWIRRGNNGSYELQIASMRIEASENDQYQMVLERQSNGKSKEESQLFAQQINYPFSSDSSSLKLPQYLSLGKEKTPFRGQLLTAVIYIPKGKVFKIGRLPKQYSKSWNIRTTPFLNIKIKNKTWAAEAYYRMGEDGKAELLASKNDR